LDRCAQSSQDATDFLSLSEKLGKMFVIQVLGIYRNIQGGAQFGTRTFGDAQELVKFRSSTPLEPLCNVRHDGNACATDLIP
jgi:hypothetical protein